MAQTCVIMLTLILCMFCHTKITFAEIFDISMDESSLLAIKARVTSDPHNFITTNWSLGTSFCTWIGVTCNRRHTRVAALDLSNMSLEGTIAPDVGNLSFLAFIDFGNNSFTGLIPDEIGNLKRLRSFYMEYNQLSGSIPWSIFNLSSLSEIVLTSNRLSGSLPSIICPPSSKLEDLRLSMNEFVGEIPRGLSNCAELQMLYMAYNNFNGSLPVDIGNLSKLEKLAIARNQLTGTIPFSLVNLSNLDALDLSRNSIEGTISSELGNLSHLTYLSLQENKLKGEVPPSIFNLSRLQSLSLVENELVGSLPSSIDKGLPNLQEVYLGQNQFTGEIPSSLSNLSKLQKFDIYWNSFSGLIPINLGNLRDLQRIRLGYNLFTNDLSMPEQEFLTSLTNCRNLSYLGIKGNQITGVLPNSLGNLSTSLEYLSIGDSLVRGTIPSELGNLHNLMNLDLEYSDLSGEIPEVLGRLRNLQLLTVAGNRLHGTIPDSICGLKNLYSLDLRDNRLTGQLPRCLGYLSSLRELYLSNNSFISKIPSTLWSNQNFKILSLSRNLFQGALSNEINNLKNLIVLLVAGNQLFGNIPSTIGQLQSLRHLEIQNNKFNGSIPTSFGNLLVMNYLDLSQNNFSGSIPNAFATLEDLDYFNVSFNQLTGEIPDGGHFRNFTAELFMGNKGLCGETRFRVEACKRNTAKSSRKLELLVYVLPPLVLIIVTTAIVIFLIRCRARKSASLQPTESPFGLEHERISYYEILRATSNLDEGNLIGKGGIGSVYKGRFSNETTAAIKVFNLDVQGAFKSFDTECQIMRSLRHRNLVKLITSCSNLEFKALVMEYMSNGNFDKWLYYPKNPLTIAQRLRVMIDVASALEYLHHGYSSPIVHCDLKPCNILFNEDMVAHVADFGISKLLMDDVRTEQTKTLGTIGYMSPEYGSAGLVSTKNDVYSYGILLMETFTKKRPTDEMFLEGLTMKGWVSESFPSAVMQIVDTEILNSEKKYEKDLIKECLVSIMGVAIECVANLSEERPDMDDVLVRLNKINIKLHSTVIEVK